jgi:hypothetical protein
MRRRSLPQVVIPVPCHVDWNLMTRIDSDGRARFCERCERPVYDSASMTRAELHDLITKHEGALPCLQLHRRPDGTIVTRNCLAPLLGAGRFLWLKVGLAAAAFWSWALGVHPLSRLCRRDATLQSSSEEIGPRDYVDRGMATIVRPKPPTQPANLLARTPQSRGWSLLPAADRAPPLRTLEAEEASWNPEPRDRPLPPRRGIR